ncbi:hypothetical protein JIG36_30470 [Actinoplanes sp. LDG1-06]|uniref:Glycine zipper domain-containing protein n=1 Tax=Paractinoplanes ovalisporus TaxID=2810368 RepID=A0ABS2AJ14_9ACTN|nr:hypothetical protein [Actinoplanes ovalisporus]MBM2619844.1 hypothetical protein [Actinoplanes ovalisporus]
MSGAPAPRFGGSTSAMASAGAVAGGAAGMAAGPVGAVVGAAVGAAGGAVVGFVADNAHVVLVHAARNLPKLFKK